MLLIGGGQAALSVSYFLRRLGIDFLILDDQSQAGGSWNHTWDSLRLFSPREYSSLPGWMLQQPSDANTQVSAYPHRNEVIRYFAEYERRYHLPIQRSVQVKEVRRHGRGFMVHTNAGMWSAAVVVSCTGTWGHPFVPSYAGSSDFQGVQLHSAFYHNPSRFLHQRVMVVGGGNSGAQVLAELSLVASETIWVTKEEPTFLPDDVDGRVVFQEATRRLHSLQTAGPIGAGSITLVPTLADIVMIDSVKAARDRGVLHSVRPFTSFTREGVRWTDGRESALEAVVWCTGFRPVLDHLQPLGILTAEGRVTLQGTQAAGTPGLWLVGYGDWNGFGSASLMGVQRYARSTATEIQQYLDRTHAPPSTGESPLSYPILPS